MKERLRKFWLWLKPVLIFSFWLSCSAGLCILLGASANREAQQPLQNIQIDVVSPNGSSFIDENDVLNLLRDHRIVQHKEIAVRNVNIQQFEQSLNENPFVERSQVFIDAKQNLHVTVEQRIPVLRVINNNGVSYYIDVHRNKMPLSDKFTARVPVVTFMDSNSTSLSSDSVLAGQLFALMNFIDHDSLLHVITEQIIVNPNREFEMISNMSHASILLGDTSNLSGKMNSLELFLKTEWKKNGLQPYSSVNLKYKNEIFCTKKTDDAISLQKQNGNNDALIQNKTQTN